MRDLKDLRCLVSLQENINEVILEVESEDVQVAQPEQ